MGGVKSEKINFYLCNDIVGIQAAGSYNMSILRFKLAGIFIKNEGKVKFCV